MARPLSLLEILHRVIERTYAMRTGIEEIARFVMGDRGYARLRAAGEPCRAVSTAGWPEAAVLVRETAGTVRLAVYYPDALIAELERHNPLGGLDAANLDAFAVFVEELDHFLTLADRIAAGRPASLFELELHAGVTKHLAARHFLARTLGRPLDEYEREWLRARLFDLPPATELGLEVQARYHDADRAARRYSAVLDRMQPAARLAELRQFHRLPAGEAVRRIDGFSAR